MFVFVSSTKFYGVNKINLNPVLKVYQRFSPCFLRQEAEEEPWMDEAELAEGGRPTPPMVETSCDEKVGGCWKNRWAVRDWVTSSVSLQNLVIRVLLWPMLSRCWNGGKKKKQRLGSSDLGGASVHFASFSNAYKYSCEDKWRTEFSNLSECEFKWSFASVLTLR